MVFDESEMSILPLALVIQSRMFRRRIATNQKDHSSYDTDNSSNSIIVVMVVVVTIIQRKYSKNLAGYQPS
jgi:hypothetical protein